jgi:hypothetical protein
MLALLSKLVPIRDWIYLGAFVALLAAFGCYTVHERHIGEQKIVAADKRAADKQAAAVAKVESDASTAIRSMQAAYNAALAAPVSPAPRLVCYAASADRGGVRADAAPSGRSHAAAAVPAESTIPFDPAPAVIGDARDADAQIALLQAYVQACQKAGVCRTR